MLLFLFNISKGSRITVPDMKYDRIFYVKLQVMPGMISVIPEYQGSYVLLNICMTYYLIPLYLINLPVK